MFTCLCGQVTVFMDDGILSSVIPELSEHATNGSLMTSLSQIFVLVYVIRVQIFSLDENKIYYVSTQSFPQGLQNSWAICGDDLPHDYG